MPVMVADLWSWQVNGRRGARIFDFGTFTYVADGQQYANDEQISSREHTRFQIGKVEQMRILPANPNKLETTLGETQAIARTALWISGGVGVVSLGIAWMIFGDLSLAIQARKRGNLVRAEVTEHIESKFYRGQLRWKLPDGKVGLSLTQRMDKLYQFPVGCEIEVFAIKGRSFWAEDIGKPVIRPSTLPVVVRNCVSRD